MLFKSTGRKSEPVSFFSAMRKGLAGDGGLYVPEYIPKLPTDFWDSLSGFSLQEIGYRMAARFIENEYEERQLKEVIDEALNFDIPLVQLNNHNYVLELFHGPTLAFKDVGARFMARMFGQKSRKSEEVVILVATSGDTGSAVAHGFLDVPGIHVCLLYPSGKVSELQEKQMTTLGGNIQALEVNGTFDDCQRLVKQAFTDSDLSETMVLSSANSINIARLLPQSFYYAHALSQLSIQEKGPPVFSVPSGNFGNLTAGLIAMKMGMPAHRFLAATNINDIVPKYLEEGTFKPRPSQRTISNAMDVGNPSNFARMQYLFNYSDTAIRRHIWGNSFTDRATRECISRVYSETGYILDPHSAVGYLASESYRKESDNNRPHIVLGTAHPAKFKSVVEEAINNDIELPGRLAECLKKEKKSLPMDADYETLKNFLQDRYS